MFIVVNEEDVVIEKSETKGIQKETGYLLVQDGRMAIPTDLYKAVYEVEEVPEEIECQKYCYREEEGFFKNPYFVRQYSNEERISALEDAVNSLLGF